MGSRPFHFKQFSVEHDNCTHKVGTDAVLLGSWVTIRDDYSLLLDIGTGSGVIALMMAQRTHPRAHIDAIEIAQADVAQARQNVAKSPWPSKVSIIHSSAQE